MTLVETLCQEFKLAPWQVEAVISLLDEGNTLPFIARYRKEAHGSLDDTVLRELGERLDTDIGTVLQGRHFRRSGLPQYINQYRRPDQNKKAIRE